MPRYLHLSESDHPSFLLWIAETVFFSMERLKAAKLGICWCFREAGGERPVLLGVHIIVLSMAGPTNGTEGGQKSLTQVGVHRKRC